MRHQISVPIEGDLFLDPHGDQTLTASRDGVQFALVPDSHNHIVRGTAMCSVPPGRTTKAVSDRLVETLKALYPLTCPFPVGFRVPYSPWISITSITYQLLLETKT